MTRRPPLVVATAVAALALLLGGGPAAAHDEVADLELTDATSSGLVIDYAVAVTYSGDGDPAEAATVTVVAESGATTVGPVPLRATAELGTYAGRLELPAAGTWAVRISSLAPAGVLERTEQVVAPIVGTIATPPPTSTATGASTTPAPTTTTPSTVGDTSTTTDAEPEAAGSGMGGGDEGTLVFVLITVVVVVGAGVLIGTGRRRRS